MSNPGINEGRQFMDCRECHKVGYHTRKAGCIIATERAAAANEVGFSAGRAFATHIMDQVAAQLSERTYEVDIRVRLEAADEQEARDRGMALVSGANVVRIAATRVRET